MSPDASAHAEPVQVIRQLDLDLPRTAGGDKSLQACIGRPDLVLACFFAEFQTGTVLRVRAMILQHLDEDSTELTRCLTCERA